MAELKGDDEIPHDDARRARQNRARRSHAFLRRGMIVALALGAFVLVEAVWRPFSNEADACSVDEARDARSQQGAALEDVLPGFVAARGGRKVPAVDLVAPDGPISTAYFSTQLPRTILINFWASWCAPCREEMPALDQLNAHFAQDDFSVIAVNLDRGEGSAELVETLFDAWGIASLVPYRDPDNEAYLGLRDAGGLGQGLPASLLVGPSGCEIGRLIGPAFWSDDEVIESLADLLKSG